jgi:hypothetical protein
MVGYFQRIYLLRVRGEYQRALEVGPSLFDGELCDLEWVIPANVALG